MQIQNSPSSTIVPAKPKGLDALADSDLVNDHTAAHYIGVTRSTLGVWRCTNRVVLPYVKCGRLVRYKAGDLKRFIADRTHNAATQGSAP